MAKQVAVTLIGANGTRTTEVKARGGFTTRHVVVPRETVPSIFSPVEPEPVSTLKPLGDPKEVRVAYIEKHTLRKRNIYKGQAFANLKERCQAYADNHDVVVHLHTARTFEAFKPEPKKTDLQALLVRVDRILGVSREK